MREDMADQPKYQAVIDWVKNSIKNGTLQYGDRLMSEKELSDKFGLSRQTIRHATGVLEKEHVITRVQGSGTYIGATFQPVRRERYMNIAVLSTFYESYIFPPILRGIVSVLQKAGYTTQVSFTDNRLDVEKKNLKSILEKGDIDGVIVEPTQSALPNPNLVYYREILSRHIPVLFFNAFYPDLNVPCVRIDDRLIADHATELLIQNGHRKIAGIFKSDVGQGPLRYQGYADAMIRHDIPFDRRSIIWCDTVMQRDIQMIEDYLISRLKGNTAVVCYNDEVAMQLINILLRHGIRVPEDISVVGIDNSNLASICRVPFTSFPHPKEKLGAKVAENLLKMIDNPDFDANYLYDAEPVIRQSVRNLSENPVTSEKSSGTADYAMTDAQMSVEDQESSADWLNPDTLKSPEPIGTEGGNHA